MNEERDILLIIWWLSQDNEIHYRCSGIGPTYTKLYKEWFPKSSYRCVCDDFPWDYFVFDNQEDHQRLLKDYDGFVIEDEK